MWQAATCHSHHVMSYIVYSVDTARLRSCDQWRYRTADIDESIETSDVVETFVLGQRQSPMQWARGWRKSEIATRQQPSIDASKQQVTLMQCSVCFTQHLFVCVFVCLTVSKLATSGEIHWSDQDSRSRPDWAWQKPTCSCFVVQRRKMQKCKTKAQWKHV